MTGRIRPPAHGPRWRSRATVAFLATLLSCSSFNREGPDVTCADLAFGAKNACNDGIIASCVDGQQVQYEACEGKDGESACDASWNKPGSFRCNQADTPKLGSGRAPSPTPNVPDPSPGGAGGAPNPPPMGCLTQACTAPGTCPSATCECKEGGGVAASCAAGCCVTDAVQLCAQLCASKGGVAEVLKVMATPVALPSSEATGMGIGCLQVSGTGNERYIARAGTTGWGVLGWSDAAPTVRGACLGSGDVSPGAPLPTSCSASTAQTPNGLLYFVSPGSGVWRSSDLCLTTAKHERAPGTELATSVATNTDGVWIALGTRLARLVTTPTLLLSDTSLEVDVAQGVVGGGSTVEPLATIASSGPGKVRLIYPGKKQETTLQITDGSPVRSVAVASSGVFVTTEDPASGGNRLSVYDLNLLARKKSYLLEAGVCDGGLGAMSVNVGVNRTVALCRRGPDVVELVLP